MAIIVTVTSERTGVEISKFHHHYLSTFPGSIGHGGTPCEDPTESGMCTAHKLARVFKGVFIVAVIDTQCGAEDPVSGASKIRVQHRRI